MKRRDFLKSSALAGSTVLLLNPSIHAAPPRNTSVSAPATAEANPLPLPELEPARWVWYPSGRCLPNTFVLFRRELKLDAPPRHATGWISADSRYLLEVNGQRIQFGPAPCDPRWLEADPLDLTQLLRTGTNVLGAKVLFYGQGDGTWPIGKPGFLFWLRLEWANGQQQMVVSDGSWQCHLARAWPPGHYKRWFLRALQEEFDARLFPYGWSTPDFQPDSSWLTALPLAGSPNKPSVCTGYNDYQFDAHGDPRGMELRRRSIPILRETLVPAARLAESAWLEWIRPPLEYFECRTPNAYREIRTPCAEPSSSPEWTVDFKAEHSATRGAVLTFEFEDQMVGWPYFTIETPTAGTVVELLVHEAHQPGGPVLINSHFDSWSRFTCQEGVNRFETFDFECCRWLQLHVRGAKGQVKIREIGLRRRLFPWPQPVELTISEPALQRLLDASVNTLNNSAQETCVDGMGRERQQYSGDGGHQLHGLYYAFGETRLPARFVTTFSQGQTLDGFFLDCWPAYDRLARLMERQLQLTGWGPLLDHGVGFNFDCWYYYLYTGDLAPLREAYPRLLRFAQYLRSIQTRPGLLPVENLGVPSVWIDHGAYQKPRHKQCAFNLYAAAMLQHALAPLARAFNDRANEESALEFGQELLRAALRNFWSPSEGLFINNLPWLTEEKAKRLCDRSLATAILFNQCPRNRIQASLDALVHCPPEMGFSYPANAIWRLWALGKAGRADIILEDLRQRWAAMASVRLNNTLQEDWVAQPDSGSQWSHCALAPLLVTYQVLAGIQPREPGFKRCEIWPQLADLEQLELTTWTVQGPIRFFSQGPRSDRRIKLEIPPNVQAELVVPREEQLTLSPVSGACPPGHLRYRLDSGKPVELTLRHG